MGTQSIMSEKDKPASVWLKREGTVVINISALLASVGLEDTEANFAIASAMMIDAIRKQHPLVTVVKIP